MYCAAKFYELLGYDAHYCRIEQFSHMELFSAQKGDTVLVFEKQNSHNKQLARKSKESRYQCHFFSNAFQEDDNVSDNILHILFSADCTF